MSSSTSARKNFEPAQAQSNRLVIFFYKYCQHKKLTQICKEYIYTHTYIHTSHRVGPQSRTTESSHDSSHRAKP
ncbi:hypothetical protein Hanom_Chr11g01058241 [Helianthus anomalus]